MNYIRTLFALVALVNMGYMSAMEPQEINQKRKYSELYAALAPIAKNKAKKHSQRGSQRHISGSMRMAIGGLLELQQGPRVALTKLTAPIAPSVNNYTMTYNGPITLNLSMLLPQYLMYNAAGVPIAQQPIMDELWRQFIGGPDTQADSK